MQATTGTKTAIWLSILGAILSAIAPALTPATITGLAGPTAGPIIAAALPWVFSWLTHSFTGNSATPLVPLPGGASIPANPGTDTAKGNLG